MTEGRSEGAAEVLDRWLHHDENCDEVRHPFAGSTCDCGLSDALASLSSSPTEGGAKLTEEEQGVVDLLRKHAVVGGNLAGLLAIIDRLAAPSPAPEDGRLREALGDAAESLRAGFVAEARQTIDAALTSTPLRPEEPSK